MAIAQTWIYQVGSSLHRLTMGAVKVPGPDGTLTDKKTDLLCHVADPEVKRKIIGDTFVAAANKIIADLAIDPDKVILGQVR